MELVAATGACQLEVVLAVSVDADEGVLGEFLVEELAPVVLGTDFVLFLVFHLWIINSNGDKAGNRDNGWFVIMNHSFLIIELV